MRFSPSLIFAVLVWVISAGAQPTPQQKTWLSYEPAVVELEGKLTIVTYSGSLNFGKDPKTDRKEEVAILELSQPINVRGNPKSDRDEETVEGVKKVQLVIDPHIPYRRLIGQNVAVKGCLFHAQMKHHFADVLLVVKQIRKSKGDKGQ